LFRLRQRSQAQEIPLGTPESIGGLEVEGCPEGKYPIIHFTSPTQRYRPYDSLPDRIALTYLHCECGFGFGHRYIMAMITAVL
jgi:hypothetical protein